MCRALRLGPGQVGLLQTLLIVILAVWALSLRGAGAALKSQLPIMGLIALSLLALGGGVLYQPDLGATLFAGPVGEGGVWTVFAVFFPAVTGIMAGIESSTVLLGWPDSQERLVHFLRVIRRLSRC